MVRARRRPEPRSTSRKANERGSRDSPQNPTNSNIYIGNSSRRHTISRLPSINLAQSYITLEHWNIRGYELVFLTKLSFLSFFPFFFKSFISIIFDIANNILNNTLVEYLWTFLSFMILSRGHQGYLSTISSRKNRTDFQSSPPSIRLPKFSQKVKLIPPEFICIGHASSSWQLIFPRRNCQIIIRGGRKSRLRLAFCPGSLPAIPRVNAANSRGLFIVTRHTTMRDHRAEQRAIVIDLRRPDHRAGRKRTARQENPPPSPPPPPPRIDVSYASNINFPPVFE